MQAGPRGCNASINPHGRRSMPFTRERARWAAGTRQRIMTSLGLAQEQGRHTMPHACRVPADALTEHDNVENNARHGCQPQRQRPEIEVSMLHGKLRYACVRATPLLAPARPPSETAVHIDIDIGTRSISISIYLYIYIYIDRYIDIDIYMYIAYIRAACASASVTRVAVFQLKVHTIHP